MTLNSVMAVTFRYFTEYGKPVLQHVTASICGGIHAQVYCILHYSSPDEFLVVFCV